MTSVGQIERMTQKRVIDLFTDTLKYDYLGDWTDCIGSSNIEVELLTNWLRKRGIDESLISKTLFELDRVANDQTKSLYDRNKAVYELLRYGVKVNPGVGENTVTVWLIEWKEPLNNDFAFAEEVTVAGASARSHTKRPDIVLYVNGIAVGVLELKRSVVSVSQGIRQNLDNQKREFIQPFFSTVQLIMAGNDTEGLRYGVIETPEKYYLRWKEKSEIENPLDRALTQLCDKKRLIELINDFLLFDAGIKKICYHNQYFGVKAAQEAVRKREGGIIWHTQGSGKSLTMVWLAKWIRENRTGARVVIITDRTELDEQIEGKFIGVGESEIYRTTSGADLVEKLNTSKPWLICSLVHKFGRASDGSNAASEEAFADEIRGALRSGFKAKGDIYVFVDECHRTHPVTGQLHKAMKALLPDAMFIGFTGTPLLRVDKQTSIEVWGPFIHTYKYNEAVEDEVIVDLRYEARDIDQAITSQDKIDQWFEAKTRGLNDLAKAQLKKRWGTMRRVLSSRDRLGKIADDIMMDFARVPRLNGGLGNALLVTDSIYSACKVYEQFSDTDFKNKCAIVTSYRPTPSDIKGEESGEGLTEKLRQYEIYRRMLAAWFNEPEDVAATKIEQFEEEVKKKFVKEPGQMKLLIVVDKLLTGFDAPPATYLYIDKQMRDHGLFQAICRVNRRDGEDKDYGYVIDYKDLFKSLETAFKDYTSGALDGYAKEDVAGLLKDRLAEAREELEEKREAIKALCEPVDPPKDTQAFIRYFCANDSGNDTQLKENEAKRLALYKTAAAFLRAFTNLANELEDAGYHSAEAEVLRNEGDYYSKVRDEVRLASGDYIDLKMYEPAMRHLLDTYIRAEDSRKVSAFDDLSLIELIVQRGAGAIDALPESIRSDETAVAETIENNVRRLIIDESPINPKYYERMSELLDTLIQQRRTEALKYEEYLNAIADLTRKAKSPLSDRSFPPGIDTPGKRALFDNLGNDSVLSLAVDAAVRASIQDDWRSHPVKLKKVKLAVTAAVNGDDSLADEIVKLLMRHDHEY